MKGLLRCEVDNMSNISKDILDLLESSGKPLSLSEIANDLYYNMAFLQRTLNKLIDEKQIQAYTAKTPGENNHRSITYYAKSNAVNEISSKNLEKIIDELNQKYVNLDSDLQTKNDELSNRIEEVENNTRNIYLNIISIISVFIAIFTLIITNFDVLKDYIKVYDTFCDVVKKMAIINIPLVIVIFFVLLMVRALILKPLISKQKKRSLKNET